MERANGKVFGAELYLELFGKLSASVFYPSGGLLETGLWEAQRNRPDALARQRPRPAAPGTTIRPERFGSRACALA